MRRKCNKKTQFQKESKRILTGVRVATWVFLHQISISSRLFGEIYSTFVFSKTWRMQPVLAFSMTFFFFLYFWNYRWKIYFDWNYWINVLSFQRRISFFFISDMLSLNTHISARSYSFLMKFTESLNNVLWLVEF